MPTRKATQKLIDPNLPALAKTTVAFPTVTPTVTEIHGNHDDPEYTAYLARIQARFDAIGLTPLFQTNAEGLWDLFIASLPEGERQFHNCNACRRFVEHFGSLVLIDEQGLQHTPLWDESDAPKMYKKAAKALREAVLSAWVAGMFVSSEKVYGTPKTGDWIHFGIKPNPSRVFRTTAAQGAHQSAAVKLEDYGQVSRALVEYNLPTLTTAVTLLKSEALYRSDRVLGPGEWLLKLQQRVSATNNTKLKQNIIWSAIATAPAGFCHPRSSMIGTLLDDLKAGDIDTAKRNFATKMNPTTYQRAVVAPTQGAIQQAEKLVKDMGIEKSLERRYAHVDDLAGIVWAPAPKHNRTRAVGGVFANVQPKKATPAPAQPTLPPVTMTWAKFQRTVLDTAKQIEVLIPNTADRFMAMVTAADMDAPPILQWDTVENRNPVSWYYAAGVDAEMRRRLTAAGGRFENIDVGFRGLWHNMNDLDIHAEVNSTHIYYGAKQPHGQHGWLDVDANAGGGGTNTPVENIRWERGLAPDGEYRFYMHLFTTHQGLPPRTPFQCEVEIDGHVYSFHGEVDVGVKRTIDIARFIYRRGQPVQFLSNTGLVPVAASPNAWGVTAGSYVPVTAVVKSPNLWGAQPQLNHGQHAFFLLEGCKDSQQGVGRGFFTEMLQNELRPARSVLERYVESATIAGADSADACGIGISNSDTGGLTVRVDGSAVYKLDRWD